MIVCSSCGFSWSLSLSLFLSLRAGAVRSALSIIRRCCNDEWRCKKAGAAGGWWSEELVLLCVERSEHFRSRTRCWREDEQSCYICRIKGSRKSHFLVQEKEKWSSKQFHDAEKNRWLITRLASVCQISCVVKGIVHTHNKLCHFKPVWNTREGILKNCV